MTMTENMPDNPREVIGGNAPDYAREMHNQLEQDYGGTKNTVAALLDEARALPKEIDSDETMGAIARVIKRIRDLDGQVEAYRVKEKEPFLRKGDAVQSFFIGLRAKLFAAKKTDAAGAGDVLQKRIDKYMADKEAIERAKRQEAERIAREAELEAARQRYAAEQKQREAEATAARARNAEKIAEAQKAAEQAKRDAEVARAKEVEAAAVHSDAKADANAKPADLTRTRLDDGVLVTSKQTWHVEIEDRTKLDINALAPFFTDDHVLAALKLWCKTTQHKRPMAGAVIVQRTTAPVR